LSYTNDCRRPLRRRNRIPDWYRNAFFARAFLLFPIIVQDKAFAMIYAGAARANSVTIKEDEIKLLRTLRNQAVLAARQSGVVK
jgi:GAF domain-containing protein